MSHMGFLSSVRPHGRTSLLLPAEPVQPSTECGARHLRAMSLTGGAARLSEFPSRSTGFTWPVHPVQRTPVPSSPRCPALARTAPPPASPALWRGWPGSRGRGNPGPAVERTVRCGAGRESSTCSSAMAATSCGTEAEMLGSLMILQYRQSAGQWQLQFPPGAGRPGLLPQPGQVVLHLLQGNGVQLAGDRAQDRPGRGGGTPARPPGSGPTARCPAVRCRHRGGCRTCGTRAAGSGWPASAPRQSSCTQPQPSSL